jgi:thiamine-phosphate pyrophosphorylase
VHLLRIIDVNLNRLDESLKLIEDIIRFQIEDKVLLSKTRGIRRDFLAFKRSIPLTKIIMTRQSNNDLGRKTQFDFEGKKDIEGLLLSNLSRAKESSRILEETLKSMGASGSNKIKSIRFQVYDLEKQIAVHMQRSFDPYLHAIIDEQYLDLHDLERTVNILQDNGATMIQLRVKMMNDRRFLSIARRLRRTIGKPRVKFIINDRVDIALACAADGIHIGQNDLPIAEIRKIAGNALIIGASTRSVEEAKRAEKQGADYLGVGAIYPTKTKLEAKVCGLRTLKSICHQTSIPVIAIGGINATNHKAALRAGAAGIAVASFLYKGNLRARIRSLTR